MPRSAPLPRGRQKGKGNKSSSPEHGQHELATRPSSPHLHSTYQDTDAEPDMRQQQPSLRSYGSHDSLLSSSSGSSQGTFPHSRTADPDDQLEGQGVAVHSDPDAMDLATPSVRIGMRGWFIRALALLCACALSVGSHYAQYFLGPIKSRLAREMGTSNAQFSLLIASFSLNNTWTPLLGGVMTARLGTAWSSIIATSLIFAGQAVLLLGDYLESVRLMALGLFVFGLGISPLAVVQETIIVRFFSAHGLGISLALGLLAGKGASFVSAVSSYPLSERFGPRAPFVVATILAGASWAVNLVYLSSSAWFARGSGVGLEESEVRAEARKLAKSARAAGGLAAVERMTEAEALKKVERKRRVRFHNITKLGDIFWAYVAVNVLCGAIWAPFLHLASNIIERRYALSEGDAGDRASLLLAGSIFLYPICGYLTDRLKTATVVHKMFILSSVLTLLCYGWLCLPAGLTRTPTPALMFFGGGHGFATLLLVIIVPHLVPMKYVSSALGVHKSLEQTGSTICQTLAGLLLDKKRTPSGGDTPDTPDNLHAIALLLRVFLAINVLQLLGAFGLWRMQVHRDRTLAAGALAVPAPKGYMAVPVGEEADEEEVADSPAKPRALSSSASVVERAHVAVAEEDEWPGAQLPRGERVQRTLSMHSDRPLLLNNDADIADENGNENDKRRGPSHGTGKGRAMMARTRKEKRRGRMFAFASGLAIAAAWALFMGVAWTKLRDTD